MNIDGILEFVSSILSPLITMAIGGGGIFFYREMKRERRIKNESSAIDVVNKAMDRLEKENATLTEQKEKLRDEIDDLRTELALKRCDKQKCITRIPPNNY